MIKNLTNEDLKILKLSFIVMLCLVVISLGFAFFIDFWQYTWALSIFICLLYTSDAADE